MQRTDQVKDKLPLKVSTRTAQCLPVPLYMHPRLSQTQSKRKMELTRSRTTDSKWEGCLLESF